MPKAVNMAEMAKVTPRNQRWLLQETLAGDQ